MDLTADRPFDHAPAGPTRTGGRRVAALDVTRALALVGVVVMNYHGYLNGAGNPFDPSWAERLFHPWHGVLATRFAATFVLVAGMGVTLLTDRSRRSGDPALVRADRLRLVRRGVVLYVGGWILDHHWPGTILFFYGAYFMIAAALITLRSRWLVVIGVATAVMSAGVSQWAAVHALDGHDVSWLDPETDSLRGLLLGTFVGGTHPVLPWLTFFCAGMIIGRHIHHLPRRALTFAGLTAVAATSLANRLGPPVDAAVLRGDSRADELLAHLLSTRPFDRGLLYTVGTLGSSIAAFCIVSWFCERWPTRQPIVVLQRAGQLTLSLYVLHVVVFKAAVEWSGIVTPTGLDTALVLAACFWTGAVVAAAWWQRMFGAGPLERLYRFLGG